MRSDGLIKHVAIAFVIALVFYAGSFAYIQHRRSFRGPWQVTFSADAGGHPSLRIAEPYLGIAQTITFPARTVAATNLPAVQRFSEAVTTLPFGEMIFQDPTFLPGTVTMSQFGHEIELLPRVLIVDKQEIRWGSGRGVVLR